MSILIKAIETEYNGYKFRSRLEARWAVFFDALGVEYEYEPEGYEYWETEEGKTMWLPDFRLPNEGNMLVEVKGGDEALKNDWDKLSLAVDYHNTPASDGLLILGEIPNPENIGWGQIPVFSYLEWYKGVCCDFAAFVDKPKYGKKGRRYLVTGIDNIFSSVYGLDGGDFATNYTSAFCDMPSCVSTKSRTISEKDLRSSLFPKLKEAYKVARQARFEHGETPVIRNV